MSKDDLHRLYHEKQPPADLEDRVVTHLRAAGSLGSAPPGMRTSTPGPWRRRAGLLAAGVALFLAGAVVGRGSANDTAPSASAGVDAGRPFMFLLWEDERFAAGSPASVAEEYAAWAEDLARAGALVSGDELGPSRLVGTPRWPDSAGLDGAHVGGYFVVRAEDAQAADRLAGNHPHLGHGGWIEVAPVLQR